MLTQYKKYAKENNKFLTNNKENSVTVECKVCILKKLQAKTSPLMLGGKKSVVIDII